MKKLVIGLVSFALLLLLNPGTSFSQKKEPVKIGRILPLTGYASWVGTLDEQGTSLQAEIINEAGGVNGHPIEFVTYDSQSTPEEASRAAHRLISRDRVVAILGDGSVPLAMPVFALGNQKKLPVFFSCGYAVDPAKEPFSFNTAHRTQFAVQRPFKYFKEKGITRIAFLMTVGPLGELGSKIGNNVAKEYGLTVVGEEKFETQAADVTPQLTKLRQLKPQAIFSFSTGEPAAMVARNMGQLNMRIPLLVSHGNATPGFLKMVGELPTQIIVPSGKITVVEQLPDSDPAKKGLQQFSERYAARFKAPATYYAGQLADAVALLAQAMKIAGTSDPVKVRDALETIKNFPGKNGIYNLSPKDHHGTVLDDMVNISPKNGKWELLR